MEIIYEIVSRGKFLYLVELCNFVVGVCTLHLSNVFFENRIEDKLDLALVAECSLGIDCYFSAEVAAVART